jgi:hypothetical protein
VRPASLALSAVFASLVLVACGSGGNGDPEPSIPADLHGSGTPLATLNDRTKTPIPPSSNTLIDLTSLRVMHIDTFDETGDGKSIGDIYVADFGTGGVGPYQGGLVFSPSYSPPSFRTAVGDVVDISTEYSEFEINTPTLIACCKGWTTPELTGATISLRYDGVNKPLDVAEAPYEDFIVTDLPSYQAHGRKWLSMLVQVKNVVVLNGYAESSGRGTVLLTQADYTCTNVNMLNDPECPRPNMNCQQAGALAYCSDGAGALELTNELYDMGADTSVTDPTSGLVPGTILSSVTGLVTLFNRLHVAPRASSDIAR